MIKPADPLWELDSDSKDWSLVYPKVDDVQLLVNIAAHCDVVVNVGSTMAHDFSIFDKPAIYICYDQPHSSDWTVEDIYAFIHFETMADLKAVEWWTSKESISTLLEKVLSVPQEVATDRKEWFNRIMDKPIDKVSKNIFRALVGLREPEMVQQN